MRDGLTVGRGATEHRLEEGDAYVLPAGERFVLHGCTAGLELLEVARRDQRLRGLDDRATTSSSRL